MHKMLLQQSAGGKAGDLQAGGGVGTGRSPPTTPQPLTQPLAS